MTHCDRQPTRRLHVQVRSRREASDDPRRARERHPPIGEAHAATNQGALMFSKSVTTQWCKSDHEERYPRVHNDQSTYQTKIHDFFSLALAHQLVIGPY